MKLKKFIATALTGALALSAALVPNIGSFAASGEWKNDGTGWWYSKADGSYAYSEWIDGYYLDANGYNTYSGVASWKKDSTGWEMIDSGNIRFGKIVLVGDDIYYIDQNTKDPNSTPVMKRESMHGGPVETLG